MRALVRNLVAILLFITFFALPAGLVSRVDAQTSVAEGETSARSEEAAAGDGTTSVPEWIPPDVGPRTSESAVRIDNQEVVYINGDRGSPVIYALTNDDWLFRSNDDGRTWRYIASRPALARFVLSPADPTILFGSKGAGCGAGNGPSTPLMKSMDSGASWVALPGSEGLRPLLAHPTDPDTLYAASCDALYLTTDGGATWSNRQDGVDSDQTTPEYVSWLAPAAYAPAVGVKPPHWGYLYAGGDAVTYSGDQGATWSLLTPRISPVPSDMRSLTADPYSAGRLWFADKQGIWSTEDFGATWDIGKTGLGRVAGDVPARAGGGLNDLLYHQEGVLYLATNSGLYQLAPGSSTWRFVPVPGVGTRPVTDILVTESDPQTLWLNTSSGAYRYRIRP